MTKLWIELYTVRRNWRWFYLPALRVAFWRMVGKSVK